MTTRRPMWEKYKSWSVNPTDRESPRFEQTVTGIAIAEAWIRYDALSKKRSDG